LAFPVIDNDELAKIIHVNADDDYPELAGVCRTWTLPSYVAMETPCVLVLKKSSAKFQQAIANGAHIIVLSDRDGDAEDCPIPSLLLTAAVHHHLIREKTRTKVGLVVEAGDVREVHHVALLIGYGAAAVNPYLVMETAEDLVNQGVITGIAPEKAVRNVIKALGKGVLKVMSKMGISTIASYTVRTSL
jgi:glutamate synthase (NADPH/NADH) large chain